MAYIFDLDQTIVDSSIAEEYRERRDWHKVYSLIPCFKLYEGIEEIFEILHENGEKTCVVTSSPSRYCTAVLDYFGIAVDALVCYHDTKFHKPYPDPIVKAIDLLQESPEKIVSVGDAEIDIIASNKAGVISCLACWGRNNDEMNVDADYVFDTVDDLKNFITS